MESQEPSVRGRLNQLVQMFENQSKTKHASTTQRAPAKKLSKTKLAVGGTQRPTSRRALPASHSVGTLIRTFNAVRPESPIPIARQPTKKWSKEPLRREDRIPEVATMMDDIFSKFLKSRPSLDSQMTSDDVFFDESISSDCTDVESIVSTDSMTECIGAMWSEDDVTAEVDMHRWWSKQLQSMDSRSKEPMSAEWKASMEWLLSNVEEKGSLLNTEISRSGSDMSSVRTYKALIEMTVFVGECCKPTINVINRNPSHPSPDNDDEIILSVDEI